MNKKRDTFVDLEAHAAADEMEYDQDSEQDFAAEQGKVNDIKELKKADY
jgi:hypothetical protein